jgi:hypothetical protein
MLPHGGYSLIPAVFTTMGWLASLFQDGCDFAKLTGDIVTLIASNSDTPYLEVGFAAYREPYFNVQTQEWDVVYTGMCLVYPPDVVTTTENVYWKVAKTFDFAATVLGGAGTFFLWFATCCVFSKGTWKWAGYEVLLASIFQGLAFLWYYNPLCTTEGSTCELYWGSKGDMIATLFWFIAAMFIFCHYPTVKDNNNSDGIMFDMDPSRRRRTTRPSVNVQEGDLHLSEPTVMTEGEAAAAITGLSKQQQQQEICNSSTAESQLSGEDSRQGSSSSSSELKPAHIV